MTDRWGGWDEQPKDQQDSYGSPTSNGSSADSDTRWLPTPAPPETAAVNEPIRVDDRPLPSPTAHDLSTSRLLRPTAPAPTGGWRRMLHDATGGRVNVGNSAKEQRRLELMKQVNLPLRGCHRIALIGFKGGVGKTTLSAGLGSTFASIRGDRVIAVDANPDRGTLSQKLPVETAATVRDLIREARSIDKYSDVRAFTSQNRHRLEVLASAADPAMSEAFDSYDYENVVGVLERFYNILVTDCGTGMLHSAMRAVLHTSDGLVIVASGSVDGASSASATLDWLDAHGYRHLVEQSITVVNMVRPGKTSVDLSKIVEHFGRRSRAVRVIPFDPHLEQGAEVDLDALRPATRAALLETAAAVTAGFPLVHRP